MLREAQDCWHVGKGLTKLAEIELSSWRDMRRHDAATGFVKPEVSTKMPKKARLIQGNRNQVTAYSEPAEYYAINHALKHVKDTTFTEDGITFKFIYAGGHSHDALSDEFDCAWRERGAHYWLDERDGANWDATMNETLLRAEAATYAALKSPVTGEFLKRCAGVTGKIVTKVGLKETCKLKYHTEWKRLSGDWNTSCGNSIVSMIICYTVVLQLPIDVRRKLKKITAFFMGDDYLALMVFHESVDRDELRLALDAGERGCGITPERGLTQSPELVSFISLGLWPTQPGARVSYAFVPHPAKQLCKLFVTARHIEQQHIAVYASEISRAFLPVYEGFEFMTSFLRMHYVPNLQAPKHLSYDLQYQHLYHKQYLSRQPIHWERGFLMKYHYPIQTLNFEHLEHNGCYHHPVVNHMLQFESADPADRM